MLDDFHFFPPVTANGNGTRTMRFMPPKDISNVCMAFTFACYSPLVSQGKVTIKKTIFDDFQMIFIYKLLLILQHCGDIAVKLFLKPLKQAVGG